MAPQNPFNPSFGQAPKLLLNQQETIQNSFQAIFNEIDSVFTVDALEYLTAMIDSYPYAYQLVGYQLWRYVQDNNCHVITPTHLISIKPKITEALYENVYYRVYDDMTAKEKDFIEAMLRQRETANLNEIHSIMGSQNITAQYRRRLIKQGVIRSTGYGRVRFNLPFFRDFLIDLSR